jgi:hypothetical protein
LTGLHQAIKLYRINKDRHFQDRGEMNMPPAHQRIEMEDTVAWSGKPLASEIGGEVVLMNIELGHYYNMDDIGSEIWRSLEQPVSVASLCDFFAAKYHADLATVSVDVLAFLNKLLEQELIAVVGG